MFAVVADTVTTTFTLIRDNRLRSVLTMFSIAVGAACLFTVMALVSSLSSYVREKLADTGLTYLRISPETAKNTNRGVQWGYREVLDASVAVHTECRACRQTQPLLLRTATVVMADDAVSVSVIGARQPYVNHRLATVTVGRPLNRWDDRQALRVCVADRTLCQRLKLHDRDLGRSITIDGSPFVIVGFQTSGIGLASSGSGTTLIPFSTFAKEFARAPGNQGLLEVTATGLDDVQAAKRQLLSALRHSNTGSSIEFSILSAQEMVDQATRALTALRMVLGAIICISLIVGGVGVMNVMLASVNERLREIGLRRSCGARRADIIVQLELEAVFLSLFGSLFGVATGALATWVVIALTDLHATVGLLSRVSVTTMAFGTVIGLAFGAWPAVRGTRVAPAHALRVE